MAEVLSHAWGHGRHIIQAQLAHKLVHLQQQAERLPDAASSSQKRHLHIASGISVLLRCLT